MINRRKVKTDKNQAEIVGYLRAHGVYVRDLSASGGVCDLVIQKQITAFLEIKAGNSNDKWTRMQLEFIAETPFLVGIAKTKEKALEYALNPVDNCIPRKRKDALGLYLDKQPKDKKFFTPSEIEKVLFG